MLHIGVTSFVHLDLVSVYSSYLLMTGFLVITIVILSLAFNDTKLDLNYYYM